MALQREAQDNFPENYQKTWDNAEKLNKNAVFELFKIHVSSLSPSFGSAINLFKQDKKGAAIVRDAMNKTIPILNKGDFTLAINNRPSFLEETSSQTKPDGRDLSPTEETYFQAYRNIMTLAATADNSLSFLTPSFSLMCRFVEKQLRLEDSIIDKVIRDFSLTEPTKDLPRGKQPSET